MPFGHPKALSAADYVVFGVTLGISVAIGICFAIKDRSSKSGTEGYLLGGRSMSMIPVSLSLSVSFMSAITVLGTPADVYRYGTMYWWFLLSILIVTVITAEIFIPVFYRLKLISIYEYIGQRFNLAVRVLAIVLFMISYLLYIGIVIYAPSLALSAVTGFNLWTSILSTGLVCIFYTTLGGFKAVIWTDVFQAVVMVMGFLAVTIQGSIKLGGYTRVWKICEEGGRIVPLRFDIDPRYRHTFWSYSVGGTFFWLLPYAVGQSQVQRYLSCKSLKQAKGSIYLNWVALVVIIALSVINGTIVYAFYHDCDPLKNGEITAYDQLLPYMSLELFQDLPGLSGLVVSCVFSGSLSTISTGINAMACVVVKDLVKPLTNWSESKYTWVTKGIVVLLGLLCIGSAYLASRLGGLIHVTYSIMGLISGPVIALFTLGMMFPFANSLGTFVGTISGLIMTFWIYIGSTFYPPSVEFIGLLPVNTTGCPVKQDLDDTTMPLTTVTAIESMENSTSYVEEPYPPIAKLYSISYLYYSVVGFFTSVIISLLVSLISGGWKDRKAVDPSLLYFFFDHWTLSWLPKRFRKFMRCGADVDETVQEYNMNENNKDISQSNGTSNDAYMEHKDEDKMSCQM